MSESVMKIIYVVCIRGTNWILSWDKWDRVLGCTEIQETKQCTAYKMLSPGTQIGSCLGLCSNKQACLPNAVIRNRNRFVKREKIEAPFKFNSENMCAKCRNCSDTPCLNYVLFKMSTDKSSIVLLKIRLYHYWINGVLRTNNKIQRQHRLKTELRAIVKWQKLNSRGTRLINELEQAVFVRELDWKNE